MRYVFCAIACSMLCLVISAQEQNADISEDARKYMDQIRMLEDSSPSELELSQQEYYRHLGILYDNLAMEHYRHYQLEETMAASEKSLPYFQMAEDYDGYMLAVELLSAVARHLEKYDIAAETLSNALECAEEEDDKDTVVKLLLQYYTLADQRKDNQKVYEILMDLKSFDRDSLGQSARIDLSLHNINYALTVGDTDLAAVHLEEYRKELESVPDELKEDYEFIYVQNQVKCLDAAGRYEEAAECYGQMLSQDTFSPSEIFKHVQILYYLSLAGNDEKFDACLERINAFADSPDITPQVWSRVRIQMVIALVNMKRYEEALENVLIVESMGLETEYVKVYKGSVLHKLERYDESRSAFLEYLDICRETYGPESLKYASALRYLANVEGFCKDIDNGTVHLIESLRLVQSIVRREIPFVSFDRLEGYWNEVSTGITDMAAYAAEAGISQGELTVAAYEGLVLSKGLLLASERSFSEYVGNSGDEELQKLYEETLILRERMEELKKSYARNKDEIMKLQPELSLKEASLAQYGSGLSGYQDYLNVTYDMLQSYLKENEVVIDFVDHVSARHGHRYLAYVYRNGWEAPLLVPVCNQEELDEFDVSGSRPDVIYGRKYSSELISLIWKPLEKHVKKGDVVYVIPSGDIHLLSLDSFQLKNGTLLGSRYDFVRLSSAKEILKGVSSGFDVKNALLYGGLSYDMTDEDRVAEAVKHRKSWRHLLSRGGRSSAGDRFYELPMSGKEVASIAGLLSDSGVETKCYLGREGTEESFVGMETPSPDIIHVATHGFYYTPEAAAEVSGLAGYKDAMRLSGLVMSGGNAEWMGEEIPENTLGGILTADDIAVCDLSGTELVVLTACDTGKGQVTSEGVYGLQRAFKKAGVQTVIMSLWKADDKAAADFMDCFYAELTRNGWNKRKAFSAAKDQMREKYRSPYYWAGFFMLD